MFGTLSEEAEVKVTADKAWQLYGTIKLGDLAAKHILDGLEVLEGDGGVGTVIKVIFKSGSKETKRVRAGSKLVNPYETLYTWFRLYWRHIGQPDNPFKGSGISYYKEKYTMIDNEKRAREAEIIEGGYLDFGFTLYRVRIEVKDNPNNNNNTGSSCLVKITIEYEVKEEAAANASLVTIEPFAVLMKLANEHLLTSD